MIDDSGVGGGDDGNGPMKIDSFLETGVPGNIMLCRVEVRQPCGSSAMIFDAGIGSIDQKTRRDGSVGSVNDRPPDFHPDLLADVLGKIEVEMRHLADDVSEEWLPPPVVEFLKRRDQIASRIEVIDINRHGCYLN